MDDAVKPAVEVPFESQQLAATCEGSGQPNGQRGCLAAGVHESHAFRGRHELLHPFRPCDMKRMVVAEVCAAAQGLPNRVENERVGVPKQQGSVSHQQVDVFISVNVPFATRAPVLDVERDGLEVAEVMTDLPAENLGSAIQVARGFGPPLQVGFREAVQKRHSIISSDQPTIRRKRASRPSQVVMILTFIHGNTLPRPLANHRGLVCSCDCLSAPRPQPMLGVLQAGERSRTCAEPSRSQAVLGRSSWPGFKPSPRLLAVSTSRCHAAAERSRSTTISAVPGAKADPTP